MAVEVQRERKRKQRILQAAAAPGGQQQPLPAEEAGRRPPLPVARLLADEIYKPVLFAVFFLQVNSPMRRLGRLFAVQVDQVASVASSVSRLNRSARPFSLWPVPKKNHLFLPPHKANL